MAEGVRKVSEDIIKVGRTLIFTSLNGITMDNIPNGSLYVNPVNGDIKVKLNGNNDFVKLDVNQIPIGDAPPDPERYNLWIDTSA